MIIGIDLDDVLAETTHALDKFHNEKYGTSLKKEDHNTFDLGKLWHVDDNGYRQRIHEFNSSDYFENIELRPNAKMVISELSKDHKIVFITARMEEYQEKTFDWLKKLLPSIEFELHHANHYYGMNEHKKCHICQNLGVDIFIDDCLDYAKECAVENIPVLLMDQPWNQTEKLPKNVTRVKDWIEALTYLKKIASNKANI